MQSDVAVADDFLQALLLVQVVVAGQQRVGRLQVQAGLHLAHAHLGFLAAAVARAHQLHLFLGGVALGLGQLDLVLGGQDAQVGGGRAQHQVLLGIGVAGHFLALGFLRLAPLVEGAQVQDGLGQGQRPAVLVPVGLAGLVDGVLAVDHVLLDARAVGLARHAGQQPGAGRHHAIAHRLQFLVGAAQLRIVLQRHHVDLIQRHGIRLRRQLGGVVGRHLVGPVRGRRGQLRLVVEARRRQGRHLVHAGAGRGQRVVALLRPHRIGAQQARVGLYLRGVASVCCGARGAGRQPQHGGQGCRRHPAPAAHGVSMEISHSKQ